MTPEQKEKLAETLQGMRRQTPLDKFQDDTKAYLTSILQQYNVPDYIVMEIAGQITVKTYIFTADEIGRALRRYEIKRKQRFKKVGEDNG